MASETLICARCGREVVRRGNRQKYCPDCSIEIKRGRARRKARQRVLEQRKTVVCPYCGVEFDQTHGSQSYCSVECYTAAKREFARKYYWNHKTERDTNTIICARCGVETDRHGGNQKYCQKCAHEADLEQKRERWRQSRERLRKEHVGTEKLHEPAYKKRKSALTLQQVAKLAREAGMTYGQYVAEIEHEK